MKDNKISVTVDVVVFGVRDRELKVLLIKRKISPFKDSWAIPGGFVREKESLESAARRELEEETGAKGVYLEQLYSFGELNRDPRGRVVTIAYYALAKADSLSLHASTDASDVCWFSVNNLPKLAFDHKRILEYAIKRLRWKFEYTPVAFSLLEDKFTLSQLQDIYQIVFNREFDKRNFRKKILSLNILNKEAIKTDVSHRPPQLYSLKKKLPEIIEFL